MVSEMLGKHWQVKRASKLVDFDQFRATMASQRRSTAFAVFFAVLRLGSCCSGGSLSNSILNDPTITMTFHPPTGWTYPNANAETSLTYFPGQSMTLSQATLMSTNALQSAVMEGLNAIGMPTMNLVITPQYTPPMISDCAKTTQNSVTATPAGQQFGYEENGAITKLVSVSAQVDAANCAIRSFTTGSGTVTYTDYEQMATVSIKGLTTSEYQMNLVAAKISALLMLNHNVAFTKEITVA
uniref:Lipoprotein n=1 Tax=Panagrellus redivivus TaxID=6233 RepID=A0A7E4UMG7_PANRE